MNETTSPSGVPFERPAVRDRARPASSGWVHRLAKHIVFARLQRLQHGRLTIIDGADRTDFGQASAEGVLHAAVTVADPHTYLDVALGGTIGVSSAYRLGLWTCDDLTALVRIFVLNRDLLDRMERGPAFLSPPIQGAPLVESEYESG